MSGGVSSRSVKQGRNRKSRDVSCELTAHIPGNLRAKKRCQNIKPEQAVTGPDTGP